MHPILPPSLILDPYADKSFVPVPTKRRSSQKLSLTVQCSSRAEKAYTAALIDTQALPHDQQCRKHTEHQSMLRHSQFPRHHRRMILRTKSSRESFLDATVKALQDSDRSGDGDWP